LVLLFLAVLWVGAGVYYYRGRPESRSADSIGSFRRQLRVLERTGPIVIDPAHRMRGVAGGFAAPTMRTARPPTSGTLRRRQVQKRRRDVFFGLLLGLGGAVLLGFIPGLQAMWVLAGVLALALAAYVAVLVQLHNRAAERSSKVHFLPERAVAAEPAIVLLRRSAN
jgi:hypothetical protein